MTKIYLPQHTKIKLGGGNRFVDNLKKSLKPFDYQFVNDGEDYDILFVAGATLCEKEIFRQAKEKGKTIILRVDNILEDGKNRNTGMQRLKEYANGADVIIYQTEWAKKILQPIIGNGVVIVNGVDTDIFYPIEKKEKSNNIRVFYSKFSRNEVKQFHEVIYWWREYCLEKQGDTLVLVGKFADDKIKIDHPFEFHNMEDYEYHGIITDENKIADILRSCDVALLPYMFDACSNSILEAQACGLPVIYSPTGGTPEIIVNGLAIDYRFKTPKEMVEEVAGTDMFNFEAFKNSFGLETMGEKYHALIQTIKGKQYEV